jgi:hypothetical protein
LTAAALERLGATTEQIDRERARVRAELTDRRLRSRSFTAAFLGLQ